MLEVKVPEKARLFWNSFAEDQEYDLYDNLFFMDLGNGYKLDADCRDNWIICYLITSIKNGERVIASWDDPVAKFKTKDPQEAVFWLNQMVERYGGLSNNQSS